MKRTNSRYRTDFSTLYSAVRNHAQKLIAQHEGGPPYDPYRIAEWLNVDVVEEDLIGVDGYVEIKNDRYFVAISSATNSVRKRFTLAHELCHVWLMRQAASGSPAPLIRYRNTKNLPGLHQDPVEESLCNYFASELLMPREQLETRFYRKTIVPKTVFTLACDYQVSKQTVGIKIANVFRSQVVACSLWSLESIWPLPLWWSGCRTPYKTELADLEELVGKQSDGIDLWEFYGTKRLPVVIESKRRGKLSMLVIRHHNP